MTGATEIQINPARAQSSNILMGLRFSLLRAADGVAGFREDLKEAAEVLGKKKFSRNVRVIIIPASRDEYLKTLKAGLIEKFVKAGALVEAPCCGPCMGGAFGLLAPGEVSLSTSNRNFKGRQGSTEGKVYLCSPATAAASAITGVITDPREV